MVPSGGVTSNRGKKPETLRRQVAWWRSPEPRGEDVLTTSVPGASVCPGRRPEGSQADGAVSLDTHECEQTPAGTVEDLSEGPVLSGDTHEDEVTVPCPPGPTAFPRCCPDTFSCRTERPGGDAGRPGGGEKAGVLSSPSPPGVPTPQVEGGGRGDFRGDCGRR